MPPVLAADPREGAGRWVWTLGCMLQHDAGHGHRGGPTGTCWPPLCLLSGTHKHMAVQVCRHRPPGADGRPFCPVAPSSHAASLCYVQSQIRNGNPSMLLLNPTSYAHRAEPCMAKVPRGQPGRCWSAQGAMAGWVSQARLARPLVCTKDEASQQVSSLLQTLVGASRRSAPSTRGRLK